MDAHGSQPAAEHSHPSSGVYVKIGLVLFVLTALEVGLYEFTYGEHAGATGVALQPFFVPLGSRNERGDGPAGALNQEKGQDSQTNPAAGSLRSCHGVTFLSAERLSSAAGPAVPPSRRGTP